MAVVRSARSAPPVGLIIFVVLWLASTGVAVWMYLNWTKAQADADKSNGDYKFYFSASDRANKDVKNLQALGASKKTAMQVALDQLAQLKTMVAGVGAAATPVDQVLDQGDKARKLAADEAGGTPTSLVAAINSATASAKREKDRADKLASDVQSLKDTYDADRKAFETSRLALNKAVEDRMQEIAALGEKVTALNATLEKTIATDVATATKDKEDNDKNIRNVVDQLRQARERLQITERQLEQAKATIDASKPSAKSTTASEADGRIVRSNMFNGEVYISLGTEDRVLPGMTFSVYDATLGVGSGTDGRGKGAIEVIEPRENGSLCRITHVEMVEVSLGDALGHVTQAQREANFQVNDLISNPVYSKDKSRKFHFYMWGAFSLDPERVPSAADRDKLVRMIQSWGGVVDDKLGSQTDYVVVGAMPGVAALKFATDADASAAAAQQRKAAQDERDAVLRDAKDFAIPVLNTNRFLAMIGYYNTTIVRY